MNDLNEIQSILKTEFAAFETSDSGILNFTQTVMQYLPEYYFRKRANGKENIILLLAKSSFTIANMLFKMDYYMRKFVYGLLCFCAMDLYMELKILYQLVHMRIRTIQN